MSVLLLYICRQKRFIKNVPYNLCVDNIQVHKIIYNHNQHYSQENYVFICVPSVRLNLRGIPSRMRLPKTTGQCCLQIVSSLNSVPYGTINLRVIPTRKCGAGRAIKTLYSHLNVRFYSDSSVEQNDRS